MKDQKGIIQIIIIVIILLGIAAGVFLVQQRTNFLPEAAQKKVNPYLQNLQKQVQKQREIQQIEIKTYQDLQNSLTDLDQTDPGQLDSNLSELDKL